MKRNWCFAVSAGFLDPPKESAGAALAALKDSGVTVKIVTGDSELVTQHVCAQLEHSGDRGADRKEIAQMDDSALRIRVETANLVFAGSILHRKTGDPRPQGPRPRGRLSGRWHQPMRRRLHLG